MKTYNPYRSYVKHLNALVQSAVNGSGSEDKDDYARALAASLDGEASIELRKLISLESLRKDGVFFTSAELADTVLSKVTGDQIYLDPACGAGNLLVACAKKIPIEKTLKATLRKWGKQLIGRDIHEEFVEATRARIALTAIQRGALRTRGCNLELAELLPEIQSGNSLLAETVYKKSSHIIINPPFTRILAPSNCNWSSGLINSAGLFMETCILRANDKTQITAILPDVLRTGSRYLKWREYISSKIKILNISSLGQFDPNVDVDVFVLDCIKSDNTENNAKWWQIHNNEQEKSVGDLFDVHVGPVVPHRHGPKGKLRPFIHARNLPARQLLNNFLETRRFNGTTFLPPFIVIRRTSRPESKFRALGCIIRGDKSVAVENHLIICKPKNGKLSDCKQLLALLHSDFSNNWLNNRIRCRHLTVSAVKELPWKVINIK